MIRRIALLVMALLLGLQAPLLAADVSTGTIEGRLVNDTESGGSVADIEVTLEAYQNDSQVDAFVTATDGTGHFIFDGLDAEPGYSYRLTVAYQDADYFGERISFAEGATSIFNELVVYDSTASDEAILVRAAHTVVYVDEAGLMVQEYYSIVNESDHTYVGSVETADGKMETLTFSLPEGATELQFASGLMQGCVQGDEEGFVDTMPVLPGEKEVAFSYRLANRSETYEFARKISYPTLSYDFFVQGENTIVDSNRLIVAEPLMVEGTVYSHSSGQGLDRGELVVALVAGLPTPQSQMTIVWIILTLGLLAGGFGLLWSRRKKLAWPVRVKASQAEQKQALLAELARLDDEFASGRIAADDFRRRRTAAKAELLELMRRSQT